MGLAYTSVEDDIKPLYVRKSKQFNVDILYFVRYPASVVNKEVTRYYATSSHQAVTVC